MENKFIGLAVGLTVGVILLSGFLWPLISDATKTNDTFTNTGRYYVSTDIDGETTITMNYDIDGTTRQWYIDGELLEYEPTTIGPEYAQVTTVIGAEDIVFRTDGRARGLYTSTGASNYSVVVSSDSVVVDNVTGSAPLFIASTTPTDYVFYNNTSNPALLKGDSNIYACGYTDVVIDPNTSTNASLVITITGNITDGVTINTYNRLGYVITVDNVVVNATAHSGYVNLYDFESIEFDVTSEYGITTHCTYSVLAVPAEITAERSNHLDTTQIALVIAIGTLGAIVLIAAAAGSIRRLD